MIKVKMPFMLLDADRDHQSRCLAFNTWSNKIRHDSAESWFDTITVRGDGSAADKAGLYILTYICTMPPTVQQHSDFMQSSLDTVHRLFIHAPLHCLTAGSDAQEFIYMFVREEKSTCS